jgi:hypothetical protein
MGKEIDARKRMSRSGASGTAAPSGTRNTGCALLK